MGKVKVVDLHTSLFSKNKNEGEKEEKKRRKKRRKWYDLGNQLLKYTYMVARPQGT
jgi:hypothetical protein